MVLHPSPRRQQLNPWPAMAQQHQPNHKLDNQENPPFSRTKCPVRNKQDRQGNIIKSFHLPCMQSALNSEDVNWAKQSGPLDPSATFNNHISMNNLPSDGPLFAYKHRKGHQLLTKSKFIDTLNAVLKTLGEAPLYGHRIQIGSTLEYLLCNIPFNVVKVKGRWASDTFLLYL